MLKLLLVDDGNGAILCVQVCYAFIVFTGGVKEHMKMKGKENVLEYWCREKS